MRYRIRYEDDVRRQTAVVEANSPAEAVVKFHHVKKADGWRSGARVRVTSVSADPPDDPPWE